MIPGRYVWLPWASLFPTAIARSLQAIRLKPFYDSGTSNPCGPCTGFAGLSRHGLVFVHVKDLCQKVPFDW
jgi:hypothetical protein